MADWLLSDRAADGLRDLLRARSGAGQAYPPDQGGKPKFVQCTSITAVGTNPILSQCYPGTVLVPAGDYPLPPEAEDGGNVLLSLLADSGAAAVPALNAVYLCLIAGDVDSDGGGSIAGRPRAIGRADGPQAFPAELTSIWNATTGYNWKRLTFASGMTLGDYSPTVTGQYASTTDANTTLTAGTRGWLAPDPATANPTRYIFLPPASGGGSLTVQAATGSPSVAAVTTLQFDADDGFVVSGTSPTARVDIDRTVSTTVTLDRVQSVGSSVTVTSPTTIGLAIQGIKKKQYFGQTAATYCVSITEDAGTTTSSTTVSFEDTQSINTQLGVGSNSIAFALNYQKSIDVDASGVKFVNDVLAPGNNKYYGTDGAGTKGWQGATLGTVTSVAASQPAAGLTISGSPITTAGTLTFAFANDLAAVESLSTTGIAARTATDTWALRTITGTTNVITVSAGDGAAGNPTITIAATYIGQNTITTLGTLTTGVWNATAVTVPYGGTGVTSFTAYAVMCGGTTSTGALQNVSGLGTALQVLTSQGAGALPVWGGVPTTGPAPNAPTGLAGLAGNAQIVWSWTAPASGQAPAIYLLDVTTDSTLATITGAGSGAFTITAPTVIYTATGLTNGTVYYARVRGVYNSAAGPNSASANATPVAPPSVGVATSTGTTGNLAVTLPTNSNGDTLAICVSNDGGGGLGTPSGWTLRGGAVDGAAHCTTQLFTIVSTGGLISVTVTGSTQSHWNAIAVNTGAKAYNASAAAGDSGISTSVVAPTVTGTGSSRALLNFYQPNTNGSGTIAIPAGQNSVANLSGTDALACGDETVGSGATGTRTGTSNQTKNWTAISVLFL